jgi:signal peptidase II
MQATRGTPVDSSDDRPAARRHHVVTRPRAWLVFATVAAVIYVTDQLSKRAAVERLSDGSDVQLVGDLLQLHLTRNSGAAFSLGTSFTVAFTILAIVATVVVIWVSRRVVDKVWAVGLGAMLAGITGNLTDRLVREPAPFRGHVIDFLQLPNWPIFNVADIAINVGAGLVLLQVFRGIGIDGSRHRTADGTADETEEPGAEPEDQQ